MVQIYFFYTDVFNTLQLHCLNEQSDSEIKIFYDFHSSLCDYSSLVVIFNPPLCWEKTFHAVFEAMMWSEQCVMDSSTHQMRAVSYKPPETHD